MTGAEIFYAIIVILISLGLFAIAFLVAEHMKKGGR